MSKTAKGLGKGFGSLLPQDFDQSILLDKHDRVQKIALTDISADPNQPRRSFDEALIGELAQSIKQYGILQPIVVTEHDGEYRIVAGERRFRAAKKAGLDNIPALVRSLKELERLEISLIENVQRVDLNPVDQAVSLARLNEQFNMSHQQIANRLGKAPSTIANILRLLQLPEFARKSLSEGRISEGHARTILAIENEATQKVLLDHIEQDHWSVRQAEQFAREYRGGTEGVSSTKAQNIRKANPSKVNAKLSNSLTKKWGFKVVVAEKSRGGRISIDFKSRSQLDEFINFLKK